MRKVLLPLGAALLVLTPLSAAHAASAYRVSVHAGPKLVDASSESHKLRTTKISGKVKGGHVKGKKVHLYAINTSANNAVTDLHTARLSGSGTFSKKWTVKRGGHYSIQAVIAASDGHAAGSDTTSLNAFQFGFMYELPFQATPGVQVLIKKDGQYTVRHTRFGESEFVIPAGGSVTFDLGNYRCKKINFKIGVADQVGGSGSYRISQGGHKIASGSMSRGQKAYEPSKKVRDRLHSSPALTVAVTGTTFVFGNAKAFCTFPSSNH